MDEFALGRRIRHERRRQNLRQDELAALCGVGTRFVSELENGKQGAELGRCLRVMTALGLELEVRARNWADTETAEH